MASNTQTSETGSILWFNLGKRMGIIRPKDPDKDDVRFDVSSLGDQDIELIWPGAQVEYLAEQNLIGMCATSVRIKVSPEPVRSV